MHIRHTPKTHVWGSVGSLPFFGGRPGHARTAMSSAQGLETWARSQDGGETASFKQMLSCSLCVSKQICPPSCSLRVRCEAPLARQATPAAQWRPHNARTSSTHTHTHMVCRRGFPRACNGLRDIPTASQRNPWLPRGVLGGAVQGLPNHLQDRPMAANGPPRRCNGFHGHPRTSTSRRERQGASRRRSPSPELPSPGPIQDAEDWDRPWPAGSAPVLRFSCADMISLRSRLSRP